MSIALDFLKELKNAATSNEPLKSLKPVYFVHGEELFVRERAIKRLRAIVCQKCGGQYERVEFGENLKIQSFIESLNEINLFNPVRMIVASEVSTLKGDELSYLVDYCKNPSPGIFLLLLSFDIDKRKKNTTALISAAASCEASHPRLQDMDVWIKGIAAESGKKISYEAINFYKDRNGNDLSSVEKEIEKASLYIGNSKDTIDLKDAELTSSGISGVSVFDMLPLIAKKNKGGVLSILRRLVEAGENPVGILSLYTARIKKMLLAKDLLKAGTPDNIIIKETGMHPYYFKSFKDEVAGYSEPSLIAMYRRALQLDRELKSSRREKLDIISLGMLDILKIS